MRALVVDDCASARVVLKTYLERHGFDVDPAADGPEAVRRYDEALDSSAPYDLVCLDILMPTLGGQETFQRIRELEAVREVPAPAHIFFATAVCEVDRMLELLSQGADGYFTKPYRLCEVQHLLEKAGLIEASAPPA